jgi:large-conductance mechanosensitive channel
MYVQNKMSSQSTILTFAVAIFVGGALKDFFNTLTRDLVAPVIAGLLPGAQQSLEKITIQLGPIKFNIGEVISATLTLAIALLVVSYTLPYLREYSPVRGGSK